MVFLLFSLKNKSLSLCIDSVNSVREMSRTGKNNGLEAGDNEKSEPGKDSLERTGNDESHLEEEEEDDEFHSIGEEMMPLYGEGDFGNASPREKPLQGNSTTFGVNRSFSARESISEHSYLMQEEADSDAKSNKRITSNDEPKPNIIVNYLPQNLTDNEFFHLFAPYGQTESIKIMRDSQTGYSFGYGFVNYIDLQDAIDARNALNGTQLGHKRIKVSFARPPSDDIKDTNLFVTGLPTTITESELDLMFSRFGVIVHLRILRDRQTKTTRGVAFVRYETRSEACSAILSMNGFVPRGGIEGIRVRLAQDHGKQKAAYLAGYQAALKMKVPASGSVGVSARATDAPFRHSETSFDLRPRNVVNRSRPMTACVGDGIRVTTSSSDPTLYWKGFIQGAREPRRPETSGGGRTSDRSTNSRSRY